MSKFKVGDRVMAVGTQDGKNLRGKIGTVKIAGSSYCIGIEFDDDVGGWSRPNKNIAVGHGWGVNENKLKLLELSFNEIHITVKGNRTIAVRKNGGKVVKRAEAVCSPDDAFDFEYGAKLAMERLFDEEPKKEPEYYSGKVVCVETDDCELTIGKVYTVKNGKFNWDNGNLEETRAGTLSKFNEWFRFSKFIEYKGEADA